MNMLINMFNDKKAGERLMVFWWIFVIAVISGGIITAVLIFYSADYEVRNVEAELLYSKVSDCFVKNEEVQTSLFSDEADIIGLCNLNKNQFLKGSKFYFRVSLYDNKGNLVNEKKEGDFSFEKDCQIVLNGVDAKHYPRCALRKEKIFIEDKENGIKQEKQKYLLEILAASNQKGERITALG